MLCNWLAHSHDFIPIFKTIIIYIHRATATGHFCSIDFPLQSTFEKFKSHKCEQQTSISEVVLEYSNANVPTFTAFVMSTGHRKVLYFLMELLFKYSHFRNSSTHARVLMVRPEDYFQGFHAHCFHKLTS